MRVIRYRLAAASHASLAVQAGANVKAVHRMLGTCTRR